MQVVLGISPWRSTAATADKRPPVSGPLKVAAGFAAVKESKMRVLVIEDEPDVNHAVATFLREEGYSVDTAKDGEEGLYK